jgi:conjugative relaxase-like TrwC/TraI family protein
MSLARLSAGCGYEYFTRHTARGDAPERTADGPASYYVHADCPPGIWLGRGLAGLPSHGQIQAGCVVTEQQMARLFGAGHDPVTDRPLGRGYLAPKTASQRIAGTVARLAANLPPAERAAQIAAITAAEKVKRTKQPVAGFDMTFSAPKSVSTLWALADADTQRAIADAHHAAVAATFALAESEVARSRTGFGGQERVPVQGLVAAAFDNYDSRAGDPQLHTHVTVANRVQTTDGRWQTLDSRSLYAASVALSETYDVLLATNITSALGLTWEMRRRARDRNPRRELAAIPDRLMAEFSQRSVAINAAKDAGIEAFAAKHGRAPSTAQVLRIRQQATLTTRQAKQTVGLDEHRDRWSKRASAALGFDANAWAIEVTARAAAAKPRVTNPVVLDDAAIEQLAAVALDEVEAARSTWSRWNLVASACRALAAANSNFSTSAETLTARDRVTRAAMDRCVLLNPASDPGGAIDPLTRRSVRDAPEVFTSLEMLAAEDVILEAAESAAAPSILGPITPASSGVILRPDQAAALTSICRSGLRCDVLVGPAGTGKTTTMAALRRAWEGAFGPGSVQGLAPSAAAAAVLGEELAIDAENTAQWLAQQRQQPVRAERITQLESKRNALAAAGRAADGIEAAITRARERYERWALRPGQLLIVDEAGMADTATLTALTRQVREADAKLLLVGDPEQLPAVGAGGMFHTLVNRRPDAPQLADVQRFRNADGTVRSWEGDASLLLRRGDKAALAAYDVHGRLAGGGTDDMADAALTAWQADRRAGLRSLLIAADNDTVTSLNLRARDARIRDGEVTTVGAPLHDGTHAGVGDVIITRRIDRTLPIGIAREKPGTSRNRSTDFVKNGDRFVVVGIGRGGSLTVRTDVPDSDPSEPAHIVELPADYVAEHVELGYAVTAHRAQGLTVDTTHTVAGIGMARETFYVAMTRGRQSNRAYIALDVAPKHDVDSRISPRTHAEVLAAILDSVGAERSAHDIQAGFARVAEQNATDPREHRTGRQIDRAARARSEPGRRQPPPPGTQRAMYPRRPERRPDYLGRTR